LAKDRNYTHIQRNNASRRCAAIDAMQDCWRIDMEPGDRRRLVEGFKRIVLR
jgi:hypothetical protein